VYLVCAPVLQMQDSGGYVNRSLLKNYGKRAGAEI
jgi:hypothetical protein